MGRYTGKTCRLLGMLSLTASFFLVEIVVGYVTNSLALVGDSYHMLSDVVALGVGLASVRISKWNTSKNTFGWARAEVLGALVNSVFLLALCFTIFIEALQRMFHDDHIHDADLMLIVGGIGLGINLIGLFLFHDHGHGHSHGGHGHSHGGGKNKDKQIDRKQAAEEERTVLSSSSDSPQYPSDTSASEVAVQLDPEIVEIQQIKTRSSSQMNMKGVFLHVLGDALGSVIVIISALVIKYVEGDWKYKIDPALSLILVCIIVCTTAPLFKESALVLLQTIPTHIRVKNLEQKLVEKVDGVLAVHEFHVWQLTGNRIIASAHIRVQNLHDYAKISEEVKGFFHNEGIHSTTIQPEFVELEEIPAERACVLECGPEKTCFTDTCCATKKDKITMESPKLDNGSPRRADSHYGNNGDLRNNAASL